jgi:hypothetical protein
MKKFSWYTYVLSFALLFLLGIPCFIAIAAEDEGTLGNGLISNAFFYLAQVIYFPYLSAYKLGVFSFIDSLFFLIFLNFLIGALFVERVFSFFRKEGSVSDDFDE